MLEGSTRYPSIMRKSTISIIGAGRIGRALGRRLREQGWKIHSVVTRSQASARRAVRSIGGGSGSGDLSPSVLSASVILISVPDSAISAVVNRLAAFGRPELQNKTVFHTSGALSSEALARLQPLGAAIGSIHPLQTFSGVGIPALDGRIFAIEGDPAAVRVARAIARALGGQPLLLAAVIQASLSRGSGDLRRPRARTRRSCDSTFYLSGNETPGSFESRLASHPSGARKSRAHRPARGVDWSIGARRLLGHRLARRSFETSSVRIFGCISCGEPSCRQIARSRFGFSAARAGKSLIAYRFSV